ncbi:MAG TPA: hypothetical protein VFN67_19430 [Polyangiales bacterium]|nr:hypothetical protein [Polyangiales bacterium]
MAVSPLALVARSATLDQLGQAALRKSEAWLTLSAAWIKRSRKRALIPQLTEAERSRLEPRVYRLTSKRGFGLRALLLGPWLRGLEQLAARFELQREAALYLAPLDAPE